MSTEKIRRLMGLDEVAFTLPLQQQRVEIVEADNEDWIRSQILAGMRLEEQEAWTLPKVEEEDIADEARLPNLEALSESILREAGKSAVHADVAKHHIKAVQASNVARKERHATADVAHTAHKNASQLHRNAAHMMRQAGDHETAAKHDAWAAHHDSNAQHYKAMTATAKAAVHTPKPAPSAHAPKGTLRSAGQGTMVPVSKETPKSKKPSASSASKSDAGNVHTPNKDRHAHHSDVAHKHLRDAWKQFHAGNHDHALVAFNKALHHQRKASDHKPTRNMAPSHQEIVLPT